MTKNNRKATCLQLQETLSRAERFKSDWMLWLPATLVTSGLIDSTCVQGRMLGSVFADWFPPALPTWKESMCPNCAALSTWNIAVWITRRTKQSQKVCIATLLVQLEFWLNRTWRETVGVTIHIFTWHMVPCGGKEIPPAGLVSSHVYGI